MKSLKNKMLLFLILLLTSFVTAYGQSTGKDTLMKSDTTIHSLAHDSVSNVDLDNMAYRDAFTYREDRDSVMDANDSLTALNIDQNKALNSANDQIKTQSVVLDAQAKENVSLKSDVDKLERKNKFWTNYAGVMTFIAGVSVMILLK